LRFVDGRPVSDITTQFLACCCSELERQGKRAWLLIWDNASWHYSKIVRNWIPDHNQQVKLTGKGVRILPLFLPTQSRLSQSHRTQMGAWQTRRGRTQRTALRQATG
jgi:hypothetical protein